MGERREEGEQVELDREAIMQEWAEHFPTRGSGPRLEARFADGATTVDVIEAIRGAALNEWLVSGPGKSACRNKLTHVLRYWRRYQRDYHEWLERRKRHGAGVPESVMDAIRTENDECVRRMVAAATERAQAEWERERRRKERADSCRSLLNWIRGNSNKD